MTLQAVRNTVTVLAVGGTAVAACALATPQAASTQSFGEKIPFKSLTILTTKFVDVHSESRPVTVWGYLSLPNAPAQPLPAMILAHGCGGIASNTDGWVKALNGAGIATFVLDSFAGRGLKNICAAGTKDFNIGNELADVYRALALLASDPRIDPQRIGLMGFSFGGWATLWASELRFQQTWMPPGGHQFAAYLAFYPACWFRLLHEDQVVDRPIRIFHGAADDYTPISQCNAYVSRMRQAGKDVALIEYLGAYHSFDEAGPVHRYSDAIGAGLCTIVEVADGQFVDQSGREFTEQSSCIRRGATIGNNEGARRQAVADVASFLRQLFKLQ